jgi:hypothetical protein
MENSYTPDASNQATANQLAESIRDILAGLLGTDQQNADNIKEGTTNLFLTAAERSMIIGEYAATRWGDEAWKLSGTGDFLDIITSTQKYTFWSRFDPAADGDSAGWDIILAPGSYLFSVLGQKDGSSGKVDWYFDAVKIISLQDWYAASSTPNTLFTLSELTVTAGVHRIKYVVNGKHASSGGYRCSITKIWFKKM